VSHDPPSTPSGPGPARSVDVVLFDRFELLDVCGPVELLAMAPKNFSVRLLGPAAGPVRSAQGPALVADLAYADAPSADIALVPGGIGTRALIGDPGFVGWLAGWARKCRLVASVCTGSGLLAAAGLLDGRRATSNKRAFAWAQAQGPAVEWVPQARWVADGDRWTSSGVAAGMDMTLALMAHLVSEEVAVAAADRAELEWHRDPDWDPFAAKNGLVS
jgi:transcriptional regulator GlxA family with amidase domain